MALSWDNRVMHVVRSMYGRLKLKKVFLKAVIFKLNKRMDS